MNKIDTITDFRRALNRIVSKGFLRSIWLLLKDFRDYELSFEILEYRFYEKSSIEELKFPPHVNCQLGKLSCRGYYCDEFDLIEWKPESEIKIFSDEIYKKHLKMLERNRTDDELTNIELRQLQSITKHNLTDEIIEELSIYDESYGLFNLKEEHREQCSIYSYKNYSEAELKELPEIDYSTFFKLNEAMYLLLKERIKILWSKDSDIKLIFDAIWNLGDSDKIFDHEMNEQFNLFWELNIYAQCRNGKIKEILFNIDDDYVEEGGLYQCDLIERIHTDGDYIPQTFLMIPDDDYQRHQEILSSKSFKECKPIIKKHLEKAEEWFVNLESKDARKHIISAEYNIYNKHNPDKNNAIRYYIFSIEHEFDICLNKYIDGIIKKLERNEFYSSKHLDDLKVKMLNFKNSGKEIKLYFSDIKPIILHLILGFDRKLEPKYCSLINEACSKKISGLLKLHKTEFDILAEIRNKLSHKTPSTCIYDVGFVKKCCIEYLKTINELKTCL
ncbi:hypothetical protein ACFL5L_03205 [candidate division KSB1 bacterium]